MDESVKNFLTLVLLGSMIALGKLLQSDEELTLRLIVGRTLLGAATSLIAGVALLQIPDMDPLALIGIGSALGIAGQQTVEAWLKKKAKA